MRRHFNEREIDYVTSMCDAFCDAVRQTLPDDPARKYGTWKTLVASQLLDPLYNAFYDSFSRTR